MTPCLPIWSTHLYHVVKSHLSGFVIPHSSPKTRVDGGLVRWHYLLQVEINQFSGTTYHVERELMHIDAVVDINWQ